MFWYRHGHARLFAVLPPINTSPPTLRSSQLFYEPRIPCLRHYCFLVHSIKQISSITIGMGSFQGKKILFMYLFNEWCQIESTQHIFRSYLAKKYLMSLMLTSFDCLYFPSLFIEGFQAAVFGIIVKFGVWDFTNFPHLFIYQYLNSRNNLSNLIRAKKII